MLTREERNIESCNVSVELFRQCGCACVRPKMREKERVIRIQRMSISNKYTKMEKCSSRDLNDINVTSR